MAGRICDGICDELETWGINLDDLREIVLRRQQEIPELDLSTIE